MKRILIVVLIAVMVSASAPPPKLNPPVAYPANLDELYTLVVTQAYGWTFDACLPDAPYITWRMVEKITAAAQDDNESGRLIIDAAKVNEILQRGGVVELPAGTLDIGENEIMLAMIRAALRGGVAICGDADGYPILYGAGVDGMMTEIGEAVK